MEVLAIQSVDGLGGFFWGFHRDECEATRASGFTVCWEGYVEDVAELAEELREFLAAKLFESGRLTLGQAAEVAGQPVWQFMESISRLGVSVINMNLEMLEDDLAAA